MKVIYSKPKRQRIKKQFWSLTTKDWDWMWSNKENRWIERESSYGKIKSSDKERIHSIKSALRHLKKHSSYLPKGTEFRLVSKLVDYDVKIVI